MVGREFVPGINIQFESHGKGRRTVYDSDTLTVKSKIKGMNPDKPQQVVGIGRVGNAAGESMENIPPIDPKTGLPVADLQLPLPDPRKK